VTVVFYISSHGFGHASRSIELIAAILARRPGTRIIVKTMVPTWLFASAAPRDIEIVPLEIDVGVAQIDSLNVDERETARRVAAFYGSFDRRADAEAAFLETERAALVLGDIPPLAFAAAARAHVASIAIGNFTWDWIYGGYEAFGDGPQADAGARAALETIRAAYASAGLALRLPLHGGFDPMARVVRDIPFIARRSTRDRAETRERLGIRSDRPFVLASFSAGDLPLPYRQIEDTERLTILAPVREAPDGLAYPDLVAAADAVVSKPGYGIVSECIANGTPLLYTSRGRFVEYEVFVREMPSLLRCRYLEQPDFLAGRWGAPLRSLLAQTPPPVTPRVDGAAVAADAIVEWAAGRPIP
jgi:L-arabinokinase